MPSVIAALSAENFAFLAWSRLTKSRRYSLSFVNSPDLI